MVKCTKWCAQISLWIHSLSLCWVQCRSVGFAVLWLLYWRLIMKNSCVNFQINGWTFWMSPIRQSDCPDDLAFSALSGPRQANLVLIAYASSESRGTFRQKARSLAPLNGWACAVKICHDGMLEDTNSLDGAHLSYIRTMDWWTWWQCAMKHHRLGSETIICSWRISWRKHW